MGLKHIMPEKYYTVPQLHEISEGEFFNFGQKKLKLAIKNGYNGIKCPFFRKGNGLTHAYYVKGADFLKFKADMEEVAKYPDGRTFDQIQPQ